MVDKLRPEPEEMLLAVREALSDLESMKAEIVSVSGQHTTGARIRRDDYWGALAATRKRLAEVEFLTGRGDWRATLRRVLDDYSEGLQHGLKVDHWVLGQFVVVRTVLGESSKEPDDYWVKAWTSVRLSLENMDANEKMWAHSSAADLLMVALAERWRLPPQMEEAMQIPPRDDVTSNDVLAELHRMVDAGGGPAKCPAVWPSFRQFWRFRYWWVKPGSAEDHPGWAEPADAGFDYLWRVVKPRFERYAPVPSVAPSSSSSASSG